MEAFERWDTWDTSNLLLLLPPREKEGGRNVPTVPTPGQRIEQTHRRVTALPASELLSGSERRKQPTRSVRFGTYLPHATLLRTTNRRGAPAHRKLARRSRQRAAHVRSIHSFKARGAARSRTKGRQPALWCLPVIARASAALSVELLGARDDRNTHPGCSSGLRPVRRSGDVQVYPRPGLTRSSILVLTC